MTGDYKVSHIDYEIAFMPYTVLNSRVVLALSGGEEKQGTITACSPSGFTIEFDDGTSFSANYKEIFDEEYNRCAGC